VDSGQWTVVVVVVVMVVVVVAWPSKSTFAGRSVLQVDVDVDVGR
jgi:hypothetical protein